MTSAVRTRLPWGKYSPSLGKETARCGPPQLIPGLMVLPRGTQRLRREGPKSAVFFRSRNFLCAASTVATLALGVSAGSTAAAEFSPRATNPRYTGSPFMHVWLPADYGASPENFCVVQDPRTGFIYVGNRDGLLEFDGVRWRLITEPGASLVRSLCIDRRGRIWGCGRLTVFRLEPDARGELRAHAMQERLPAEFRSPGPSFRILATARGVYACGAKYLMFFPDDEGPAQVWPVAEGAAAAQSLWQIGDEPYVELGAPANATIRRRGEQFERVPSLTGQVFAARVVDDGAWQLATKQGIRWWNGAEFTKEQRPIGDDAALQSIFLADGRIAIATVNRGLVVCDREGRILRTVGRADGLPANQVRDLAADREGGVWVVLPYGIARVQLDSPYARHGPAQGLEGTVSSMVRHRGALFVGGSEGVAQRGDDGQFRAWPGLPGPIHELVSHDGWLLSAGPQLRGVPPGSNAEVRVLENVRTDVVLPLAGAPGWYAFGSSEGLRWGYFVGEKWTSEGPLKAPMGVPTELRETPAGVVWAGIGSAGTGWRIDFRGGLTADAPARLFNRDDGIPGGAGLLTMFKLGADLEAVTNGRLRRFDETTGRFVLETRVAGLDRFPVELAHTGLDGTVWLQRDAAAREIRRLVPEAADSASASRWRAEPLPGAPLQHLLPTALFHDETTQTLWIAGHGALISCDLTWRPTRPVASPVALLRRVETSTGQLVLAFNGARPAPPPPVLEPEQDDLRIFFAAPTFVADHEGVMHTQYRVRLDGLDHEWSGWSDQAEWRLTNLPWRAFTFRVQACDDAGRIGPEAAWAFSIRPAWWATYWAWSAYGAFGALGLVGIVRRRTQVLRRRSRQLEATVGDRTRELAHSNAQLAANNAELARLHRLELDEKIAAQLSEEKARLEVLRYQLNPHFLYNSLNSVYGLLFENPRDASEMVLRLSDFCRAALTNPTNEPPTVADELALLRTYLDVEQVRWGEKLKTEIVVAPELQQIRIPPFLLLPLVENAIKYGSRTTPGVLQVSIRVFSVEPSTEAKPGPSFVIEIANTGEWLPHDLARPGSTGLGLENLQQRLHRYYPGTHAFTTEEGDGWVVVRLRLSRMLLPGEPAKGPT